MKVLITGSDGLVGRHFARHFAAHDLTLVDLKTDRAYNDCRRLFAEGTARYDLVIHGAAVVGGRTMIEGSPFRLAAEDLSIDAEMWRWALRTKPHHIVYFSSSAAYPVHLQAAPGHRLTEDDIDLDHLATPDETYGWVKLTGELMARKAWQEGLRVHVFRPFSGYAKDQDLDYPWPSFLQRAMSKASPFEIWGDGTQVRDWIHLDDIVRAVESAVVNDIAGPVNLCTGIATPFNELAETMMRLVGYEAPIKHLPDQPRGVLYRVGNPEKLHTFYTPRISVEDAILDALGKGMLL